MNEPERMAKAHRAKAALEEFVGPVITDMEAEYTARIVELANSELSRDKRADKLTALSNALRIAANIRAGINAVILDGDVAQKDRLRAEKIENMTAPQRRLLNIIPR